ncbi:MAG: COX15/CtaA family protein [Bacteroidia bacterium]|nr:COX15/CtaA family protein [Bacteroidia bacterium]MBT8230154.1 COX15/CtaA family protein [Bacteroidia bacterium]MBT8393328.1 COX15/CtaA family protein [Bacteroidia bacterium]
MKTMKYNKFIKIWLVTGCVLLFFQIFIGGITRITGSGLSITKWEIVTGTLPPLSEAEWDKEYALYQNTPQYEKINNGLSMSKFKFIYFWEYFHRLWARLMGIIFLIPLIFFVIKKWVDKWLLIRLAYVFFCALLAAVFGWIMVASGLINRPWVNAYKLSLHLGIALLTYSVLLWTTFGVFEKSDWKVSNYKLRSLVRMLLIGIVIQIFFGAIVSGMRASLFYPSWPDMNGSFIPAIIFNPSAWNLDNIINYDQNTFMPALIHVLHRNWGYIVFGFGIFTSIRILQYPLRSHYYKWSIILIILLCLQVLLGILTLINSIGTIPVFYGVMHQAVAIFILSVILYLSFIFRYKQKPI